MLRITSSIKTILATAAIGLLAAGAFAQTVVKAQVIQRPTGPSQTVTFRIYLDPVVPDVGGCGFAIWYNNAQITGLTPSNYTGDADANPGFTAGPITPDISKGSGTNERRGWVMDTAADIDNPQPGNLWLVTATTTAGYSGDGSNIRIFVGDDPIQSGAWLYRGVTGGFADIPHSYQDPILLPVGVSGFELE